MADDGAGHLPERPPSSAGPALAGMAAAAVGLGAGELVSGLAPDAPSLLLSVGQWVIERAPPAAEDFAIALLGTGDKLGLVVAMTVVALAAGAAVGRLAIRHMRAASSLYVLGGAVGVWATLAWDSRASVVSVLAGAAAVAAGILMLRRLLPSVPAAVAPDGDPGRRAALRGLLLGVLGAGVVGAGAGRLAGRLLGRGSVPSDVTLGTPARPLPPPAAAAAFEGVPGLTPLFTPNRAFFRIDTALTLPRVDLDDWRLRVTGMVDRPFELSYAELATMPQVESDITMCCVSNEVGGKLVGNARWQGILLRDILDRAGVQPGATQVVARSVDGWTAGFPTDVAVDGRPALVALGMNGEPLPIVHGFPARLVVPGLYGYVSATKWLGEIELTTLDAFDAYWVPRGWNKLGPIDLQSRIDVPRSGQSVPAGRQAVAGVAWAPRRGVAKVEVSVDDGAWQEVTLAGELSGDTWRQWRHTWDATPGRHRITTRATAADGEVQTADRNRPRPGGATGHHSVVVTVA